MPAKSLFRAIIALILLSAFAYASVGRISVVNGDVSIERGVKSEKAISNFQLEEKDVIKSKTGATAQLISQRQNSYYGWFKHDFQNRRVSIWGKR